MLPLVPVPLVPELVPPLIADDPLPIFALVRTNCELLAPAAELDEPVAEPVPVPEVPVAPAMSDDCRHPVTVTCACVLELGVCGLLLVEPDCALSVPASAIESTVPNTTLRFIYYLQKWKTALLNLEQGSDHLLQERGQEKPPAAACAALI